MGNFGTILDVGPARAEEMVEVMTGVHVKYMARNCKCCRVVKIFQESTKFTKCWNGTTRDTDCRKVPVVESMVAITDK